MYGHVITKFRGWVVYHIFLPMVLRRRPPRAKSPLSMLVTNSINRYDNFDANNAELNVI